MNESDRRLRGIERKLSRGEEHLAELQDLVNAHVEANPITLLAEPQGEAPTAEYHIKIEEFNAPDYIDIGVRIGEALHLYRSILENLVWHLVIKNTGQDPPPKPKSIGFPIIDLKRNWSSRGLPKIESIAEEPATLIRRAQPFRARHAPNPEPLGLLATLNNKDKHRVIVPMAIMPKSFKQVGSVTVNEPDMGFKVISTDQWVEKDATVYIFRFSKPTYVNMEFHGTFAIVLDLTGFKNVSVKTTYPSDRALTDIANEVRRIAVALKPYL